MSDDLAAQLAGSLAAGIAASPQATANALALKAGGFTTKQVADALSIVTGDRFRLKPGQITTWLMTSSRDASVFWLVVDDGEDLQGLPALYCNCPTGSRMRPCYHMAAAILLRGTPHASQPAPELHRAWCPAHPSPLAAKPVNPICCEADQRDDTNVFDPFAAFNL